MNWLTTTGQIILIASLALLIGWFYGYPLQVLIVVLSLLIGFWIYQMQKVRSWLQDPSTPPPDAFGIWGDLLARIYHHQRNNREIQSQLQDNVKYLQDSFASMRDGVVMVTDQGAIKWFNTAVEPLLGLRFPDDTAQPLTNIVRDPEFNQYFLHGDYKEPLQYIAAAERARHLRVEITYFGAGERLLFVRDISAAVRLEQTRRDFVANVSHELRTPLTVISGYLQTFIEQESAFPQPYAKAIRQMSQQADRMESLLKDLLWLSRIESEERNEKRELVNLHELLEALRGELKEAFADRTINLVVECEKSILGDYRELYSAISNLLINALKYSESPSPVSIRYFSENKNCVVEVQDEGVGIDEVHLPRLTERFYRVDESRSTVTGGTGLGLAIVKHVVAAHQGELRIQSKLSHGSTFSLVFPEGGYDDA